MNFEFPQKITEDLIFSKFPEETIMEFYLHHPVKKGLFCSPLRVDKNPTCSFFRNKSGKLIFKDFATGQYLSCINVVMTIYNCNYYDALKIIANDFGIVKTRGLTKNKGKINMNATKIEDHEMAKIQVEVQDFSDLELKWWAKYGITLKKKKKFQVYSCKHVFLNDQLIAKSQQHCPIYGYYGGTIKQDKQKFELWKCYFPKRKQYRFLGNYPAKKLQGYDKLPKKGKFCVLTKSLKDSMCFNTFGIPACAPNSETVIPSETIINDLLSRFKYVFALWDNDETGVTFLRKMKKMYPKLHCLIIPRKLGAKDFSDLRAKYGYNQTKKFIIQYLKEWRKNRENQT